MDSSTRVQILNKAVDISHTTIKEGYESIYSPTSCGWIVGQTGLLNLVMATGLEEWKLWIQTQPGEGWAPSGYS